MLKHQVLAMTSVAILLGYGVALADTCPTHLKQDEKGFWYSEQKPGWKSHIATPKDVKLSSKEFGGVVYSPKRKRLACVYRASNKKWVALVSNAHASIEINKKMNDDSGKNPAWKFSRKHKDYACGRPYVQKMDKCEFTLMKKSS